MIIAHTTTAHMNTPHTTTATRPPGPTGAAPAPAPLRLVLVLVVIVLASWTLLGLALLARTDLVEQQVAAVPVDPEYRGVAVGAAMTFTVLGHAALLTSLQLAARWADRLLRRLWWTAYRPGAARLTLGTVLVVALAADLVRGVDAARLGDAIPFVTAPVLAVMILALHHRLWRQSRGATGVLGWAVVVGLACLTVGVLGT